MGIYDRDYMKRPSNDDDSSKATPQSSDRKWVYRQTEDPAEQAAAQFIEKHWRLLRNCLIGFGIFLLIVILAIAINH